MIPGKPPERGLIVREPWVSMLLEGTKTWELRGSRTSLRGTVGLIGSGTGTVLGTARLDAVVGPLTREDLESSVDRHRVDWDWANTPLPYRNVYAWVFSDGARYTRPLRYTHPAGAVIWVKL